MEILKYLLLHNNFFSGSIPDSIWNYHSYRNSTFLKMEWKEQLQLVSPISGALGKLGSISLTFLTLSNNNQFSGEVSAALKKCTDNSTLDLGDNKLSGNIPAWIGESFPSLLILRLRSNLFHGKIPSPLCNLSSLHKLDLAHNNLSALILQYLEAGDLELFYESFDRKNTWEPWK